MVTTSSADIADAEARTPATFKLLHWRAGTTTTVQLTLRTLGTYSATASASEREGGHTGAFFNYLWAPLGANCGGEEAAASHFSHFSRIAWHLDLARRWNGGFANDCLSGEGPNSSTYGPKGILYNSLAGIDSNLLYPAIRAMSVNPIGLNRSTLASTYSMLTREETKAVADAIVDSVRFRAPADKMFSAGVRQKGLEILQKYGFAEGVPVGEAYIRDEVRDAEQNAALAVLEAYAGSCTTVVPDPDIVAFLQELLPTSIGVAAQEVLDAIANNPNPAPLTPFKSIQSVTADAPFITLPAHSTVLRISAFDHASDERQVTTSSRLMIAGEAAK